MAKPKSRNITLRIDDDLANQLPDFEEINWSAVARKAFENRIKREKKMIEEYNNQGRMF